MGVLPVGRMWIGLVTRHVDLRSHGTLSKDMMARTARVRDSRRWGMLSVLMSRLSITSRLLVTAIVVPLLSGCGALGIPDAAPFDATTALPDPFDPAATVAPVPSPIQVASKDGYTLTLPGGWVGTRTNGETTRSVFDTIAVSDGLLGEEASDLYGAMDADLSMVAADVADVGVAPWPSVMAILVVPSQRGSADTQRRMDDLLASLVTVTSEVTRSVVAVRAGDAQRYDLTVAGDVLAVQLRAYLFTIGDDGIVVLFASDPAFAGDASADMDAIVKSLRFGV